ncbi:type II secretion system protein [Shewanella sp. YIC-542]|uniref:type II secretion system protein n=1 Tax=Shewanella mytili TaxID=3377111 RepID=UPI00398EBD96
MMKKQHGFTLIELVVVIIILGILAVVAAPKFLNLQGDAREASIKGFAAALKGTVQLSHAKALIEGKDKQATGASLSINGSQINLAWGYPIAADSGGIIDLIDDMNDWTYLVVLGNAVSPSKVLFTLKSVAANQTVFSAGVTDTGSLISTCYVQYQQATDAAPAAISFPVNGLKC